MEAHKKSEPAPSLSATLAQDHRRCDGLFARAEERASKGDWAGAEEAFSGFVSAMENHLGFEEQTLFPAFEQATGSQAGPTQVMRMEHTQMRALLREMGEEIRGRNANRYLGLSETLLIMMQQHNMKEEHVLYRLAEQVLGEEGPALAARLAPA